MPVDGTLVFLFTPGPVRWKLWMFDLSDTLIVYDPARRLVTFELPFFMPIVKPGPTVAFNVVAACATATDSADGQCDDDGKRPETS